MPHLPEPVDVDAAWRALVGAPRPDGDLTARWGSLATCIRLITLVDKRLHDERALIALRWWDAGDSYAVIGERVGLTRGRVQQLVERGRLLGPAARARLGYDTEEGSR